jgi:hypothetical protein
MGAGAVYHTLIFAAFSPLASLGSNFNTLATVLKTHALFQAKAIY